MSRIAPWLTAITAASLLLTACSTSPEPTIQNPTNPYAGGKSYPWSDRLEAPVADPYAAGRDYPWASPVGATTSGMDVQGLATGVTYLSDLAWTEARNDWGPIERDRSNGEMDARDGRPLTIGGQTFAKGLGVHTYSFVDFDLNRQCATFSATIGIDDEVGNRGQAVFAVIADPYEPGDNKERYLSKVLTGNDGPVSINVDITGVRSLFLGVYAPSRLDSSASASIDYAHADWANARVTCKALPIVGSVSLSQAVYTSATNGWGPVETDRSNGEQRGLDGKPLVIGNLGSGSGQAPQLGLGVHAPSTLVYTLGGTCTGLTGLLGLDQEVAGRGSVRGLILGDGRTLWESPLLTGLETTRFDLDVTGIRALSLIVSDGGDNKQFDHADWFNPVLTCRNAADAATLSLDRSYGVNGVALSGGVTDAVMEPDGNVVVAGRGGLARYSPTGQILTTEPYRFPGFDDFYISLTRQSDGKFLVTDYQWRYVRGGPPFVIARFTADLKLDTSFGQGGYVYSLLVEGEEVTAGAVLASQPDGKVILYVDGGTLSSSLPWFLVRLNADGSLDSSFGTGGQVVFPDLTVDRLSSLDFFFGSVLVLPGGKIMVAGAARRTSDGLVSPVLLRLLPSGVPDRTFGSGGVLNLLTRPLLTTVPGYAETLYARPVLLLQPDGKLLARSAMTCPTAEPYCQNYVFTRLSASGSIETSAEVSTPTLGGRVGQMTVGRDGGVLLGLYTEQNRGIYFQLSRLNADLTLERPFTVNWGEVDRQVYIGNRLSRLLYDPQGRVMVLNGDSIIRLRP